MNHQQIIPLHIRTILLLPFMILINGCDDRATHIALQAADRQAQQNVVMSELNKEVAFGAQRLVTADAHSRNEILKAHRDLQSANSELASERRALDAERRQIISSRRLESILAPTIKAVGIILVVVTLLGFSWHLLAAPPKRSDAEAELNEFLVTELITDPSQRLSKASSPLSLSNESWSRKQDAS